MAVLLWWSINTCTAACWVGFLLESSNLGTELSVSLLQRFIDLGIFKWAFPSTQAQAH